MSNEAIPPDRDDLPREPDLFLHEAVSAAPQPSSIGQKPPQAEEAPLAVYLLNRVVEALPPEVGSLQNVHPELHDPASLSFAIAVKATLRAMAQDNKPSVSPDDTSTEDSEPSISSDDPPAEDNAAASSPSKQAPYILIPDSAFEIRFKEHQREIEHSPAKRGELQFKHAQALNLKRRIWHAFPEISLARALNSHVQSMRQQYPGAAAIMQDVMAVYDRCVTAVLIVSEQNRLRQKMAERQRMRNIPHE